MLLLVKCFLKLGSLTLLLFSRGLECLDNDKEDYFSLLVVFFGMYLLDFMTAKN